MANLGGLGDVVNVKPGYGRNFLLPSGKAVVATEANKIKLGARRAELEKVAAETHAQAETRCKALNELTLSIAAKVGDAGKLFGSVAAVDIAQAATDAGVELKKSEVRLPDGPLREIGEYDVEIHLHADVNASLKVEIVEES